MMICFTVLAFAFPVQSQMATMSEALIVANNWITLIIQSKGSWGGSETAEVETIQEFKRGDRLIGYFCRVYPQGFIITSLHMDLAPVKAYSARGDLNPEFDEDIVDLIKGRMEGILKAREERLGALPSVSSKDLLLNNNYRQSWEKLKSDAAITTRSLGDGVSTRDYQEGEWLLSTNWHQKPPYNNNVPNEGCSWPKHCNYNNNARAGCVAICGAQVMRYWAWPPGYDWPNMPDDFDSICNWDLKQVDAVAELIGYLADTMYTSYGCGNTSSPFADISFVTDLLDAFGDTFEYHTPDISWEYEDDFDNDAVAWFEAIKDQLNLNRPLPFNSWNRHAWVCDGWQEIGSLQQYHMNLGWGAHANIWYDLNVVLDPYGLPYPKEDHEMIAMLYPKPAIGKTVLGYYSSSQSRYRYFDRDATGDDIAIFSSGSLLQFLPGVRVTGTGSAGNSIRFEGSSSGVTYLFTNGDKSRGIRIDIGTLKLSNGGSITFPR